MAHHHLLPPISKTLGESCRVQLGAGVGSQWTNPDSEIPSYGDSDVYVPTMPPTLSQMDMSTSKVGSSVEEEVQSGLRTQRVDNPVLFQQKSGGLMTQNFSNPVDRYGFRYPTQWGGFGFRQ
ncbi:hypothetical protein F3Y22_tig00110847pilonHSYRG00212 [Hibiscus syriacus]|uniref:Uncharacterized protein n=1 Tax=Hibiscus syriacus TaxID=106335 RepID=A0A6A2ZKN1_HIBSY|nr:hypothetical protein F3Y22_tig00110847pilonHSYRG00212 [Hibiscus syriacus]